MWGPNGEIVPESGGVSTRDRAAHRRSIGLIVVRAILNYNSIMETILRRIVYICIFIVPFVALLVAGSSPFSQMSWRFAGVASFIPLPELFFPFITAKAFVFRTVVEIMFAAWLLLALRDRVYAPKKSVLLYGVVALMVTSCLAWLFSENPHKSFWSNFERMEGFFMHLHFAAFFLVAGTMLSVERAGQIAGQLWRRYFNVSLGVATLIGLFGIAQLTGTAQIHQGSTRIDATLGNSAYFAVYALFHLFISIYFLVRYIKRERAPGTFSSTPYMYGAFALLQAVIVYYTATRGAIIGMGVGLLFVAVAYALRRGEDKILRRTGYVVCSLFVAALILFVSLKNTAFVKNDPVLSRFSSLATLNFSSIASGEAKSRLTIWPMAIKGAMERPIVGWGQESFNYLFYKYYEPRMYNHEAWFDRAHNVFLDWLVSAGLLGFLAYLILYGAALVMLTRGSSWSNRISEWFSKNRQPQDASTTSKLLPAESTVFVGLLIAYFIHNIFVFDNNISYILFFGLLAWLHGMYGEVFAEKGDRFGAWTGRNARWLGAAVIVAFVAVFWWGNVRNVMAAHNLAQAVGPVATGIDGNLSFFKAALANHSFADQEIRERLAQLASDAARQTNLAEDVKQRLVTLAIAELKTQLEETPNDVRLLYFYGALLGTYGRYQEALPYVTKAVELSPKKQMLRVMLGSIYLNMNNTEQGLEQFRIAYELEMSNPEAVIPYAAAAIIAHKDAIATDVLKKAYGTDLVPDNRIIQALVLAKRYDKLVLLFKQEVEAHPDNTGLRAALIESYYRAGDSAKAIAEARKAIADIPDFKADGEKYIQMIRGGK